MRVGVTGKLVVKMNIPVAVRNATTHECATREIRPYRVIVSVRATVPPDRAQAAPATGDHRRPGLRAGAAFPFRSPPSLLGSIYYNAFLHTECHNMEINLTNRNRLTTGPSRGGWRSHSKA